MHSFTFLGFTFTKGPSRQDMEVKYYHLFQVATARLPFALMGGWVNGWLGV